MKKIEVISLIDYAKDLAKSPIFIGLALLIVIDILTGIAKGVKQKNLDSSISTNGFIKHTVILIIAILVGAYTRALEVEQISHALGLGFCSSYGVSILENLDALGIPFPEKFRAIFKQMREQKVNIPIEDISLVMKDKEDIKNIDEVDIKLKKTSKKE